MPQPRCLVRCRTSFTPILRMTSGCALTQGPCAATSRSIASSTVRVLPVMDRIDPDQHAVDRQQLLADLVDDVVVVNRGLGVDAERGQLLEDAMEAIVLRCRCPPRLMVAAPEQPLPEL